jgi:hypothetical protein
MYADGKRLARIQTEKNKNAVYVSPITNVLNATVVIHAANPLHVTIRNLHLATTTQRASLDIQP